MTTDIMAYAAVSKRKPKHGSKKLENIKHHFVPHQAVVNTTNTTVVPHQAVVSTTNTTVVPHQAVVNTTNTTVVPCHTRQSSAQPKPLSCRATLGSRQHNQHRCHYKGTFPGQIVTSWLKPRLKLLTAALAKGMCTKIRHAYLIR